MISHSVLSLHDLTRAFDRVDLSFHLEIFSSLGFQNTLPFSYFSLVMAFTSSTSPAQPHNVEIPLLIPVISSSLTVLNTHICQRLPNIKLQLRPCFWTWELYSNCLVKVSIWTSDISNFRYFSSQTDPPTAFRILMNGELPKSRIYI